MKLLLRGTHYTRVVNGKRKNDITTRDTPRTARQTKNLTSKILNKLRKVILGLAVSLDGFIEGQNGEYDWCFTDQDYGMSEFMSRIDAVFVGRKTYEMSLGMEADPSGMAKMEEYIFSKTLDKVKEGAILLNGDLKTEVERIKKKDRKDIWLFGGAELTRSLMNLKLVDEIHLSVHPILLGGGKPLFRDITDRIYLKLIDTKTYSTGLVSMKYSLTDKKF
jgi:dihydrofolate reductase